MIGFFQTFEDLQSWARGRAAEVEAEFDRTGSLVSLGYAMALRDIARSEMGPEVEVPGYQRALEQPAAEIVPIAPLRAVA